MPSLITLLIELESRSSHLQTAIMFGCGDATAEAKRVAALAEEVARKVEACGGECADRLTGEHANRRLS